MTKSALWLKHDAHFGEHPKTLRLRRMAGRQADSAECGWWRIVEGAKRYGEWTFEGEEHLEHVAGAYARYLPMYRAVGLLDDLTIHNADEYQSPLTGAERVARHRDRSNADTVTPVVTAVTPREEKSREERTEQTAGDPADDYWNLTGKYPNGNVLEWIDALTGEFGADATSRAIARCHREDGSTKTLLGRAQDVLRAGARKLDRQERAVELAKVAANRAPAGTNIPVLISRHNHGQHADDPDPACPSCRRNAAA